MRTVMIDVVFNVKRNTLWVTTAIKFSGTGMLGVWDSQNMTGEYDNGSSKAYFVGYQPVQ